MRSFCVFFIILFVPSLVFSQTGGEKTYQFLSIPYGSRIAALGGNNVSNYHLDLNFVAQNPALLRASMSDKLILNYVNYISDINMGNFAFAKKIEKVGIFVLGLQFNNYGIFKNTDYTGLELGNFSASDYVFSGSYSVALKKYDKLRFGASLKMLLSDYWLYSSFGLAIDAGVSYIDTAKNFSAGLVIKNLGLQMKRYTKGNSETLPIDIQIGFTQKFEHAPIRISVTAQDLLNWKLYYKSTLNTDNTVLGETETKKTFFNKLGDGANELIRHFVFGVEFIPHKVFHIDIGFNIRRRLEMAVPIKKKLAGFSAGIGLDLNKFNFSYAIGIYHISGLSHHIGLGLNLNTMYKKKM